MKTKLLLCLPVLLLVGCSTVKYRKWVPQEREGVVSVDLCAVCSEPYDYQKVNLIKSLRKKCGRRGWTVLEEGTGASGIAGSGFYQGTGGGGGTINSYYIKFKCK